MLLNFNKHYKTAPSDTVNLVSNILHNFTFSSHFFNDMNNNVKCQIAVHICLINGTDMTVCWGDARDLIKMCMLLR